MKKIYYRGVTFKNYEKNREFVLTNINIVKQDLLNHMFTKLGERIMMPRFGTRIQDMLMEPMDDISLDIIEHDVRYVLNYDPRVTLLDLEVSPNYDEKTATFSAMLRYNELRLKDRFDIVMEFGA